MSEPREDYEDVLDMLQHENGDGLYHDGGPDDFSWRNGCADIILAVLIAAAMWRWWL